MKTFIGKEADKVKEGLFDRFIPCRNCGSPFDHAHESTAQFVLLLADDDKSAPLRKALEAAEAKDVSDFQAAAIYLCPKCGELSAEWAER